MTAELGVQIVRQGSTSVKSTHETSLIWVKKEKGEVSWSDFYRLGAKIAHIVHRANRRKKAPTRQARHKKEGT